MLTEEQKTVIEEQVIPEGAKMFVRVLFNLEDASQDNAGLPDRVFVVETMARMMHIALAGYGDVSDMPAQDQFYLAYSRMCGYNNKQ